MKAKEKPSKKISIVIVVVNFLIASIVIAINIYVHAVTTIEVNVVDGQQVVEVVNSYADYFGIITIISLCALLLSFGISIYILLRENKKTNKRLQVLVDLFDEVGLSRINDYDMILTEADLQIIEAWNRSVAEIDYINELREKYFKNMVHDLKSPLQILSMNTQMLELTYPKDEFVKGVKEELEILEKSVSNYLMIEKIAFFESVEKIDLDIESYFLKIANRYKRMDYRVDIKCCPGIKYIETDESMFSRIVENLIDNSVKYGSGGKIEVLICENVMYFTNDITDEKPIPDIFSQKRSYSLMGNGLGVEIINAYIKLLGWTVESKTDNKKFIVSIKFSDF